MPNPTITIVGDDQASGALGSVSAKLESLAAAFGNFGSLVTRLGIPLLGVTAAIAGIGAAVTNALHVTDWVDNLVKSGSALGITAENMAKYTLMAKQAGIESGTLASSFATLAKNVEGARAGQAEQVELFRRFGISVKELKALTPDELIKRIAIESEKLEGGFAKANLQVQTFAKGGKQMDDVLHKIASGMEPVTGLTKEFVERSQTLKGELDTLQLAWTKYSIALAGPVVDALLLVGRTMGFIEKAPQQQRQFLEAQIANWESIVKTQEDLNKRAGKAGNMGGVVTNATELKDAVTQLERYRLELEKLNNQDLAGPPEAKKRVPDKIDQNAIDRARKRFEQEEREILKEQREMALRIERETEREREKVEDANNRFRRREFDEQKEHDEKMIALAARVDKAENEAAGEGQERLRRRREELFKETEDKIDNLVQVTESFFLRLTSFDGTDVFKTMGKDLLNMAYRLLIIEPILERIRDKIKEIMRGDGDMASAKQGGSWIAILAKIAGYFFGSGTSTAGTGVAGGTEWNALGGPASFAQVVGEAGPELFVPGQPGTIVPNHLAGGAGVSIINNYTIDSRTDRGTIAAMLEANRAATLREVREQLSRRGTLLRV